MWISENKLLFKILLSSFMMIFLIACSSDSDEKNVDQFTNVSENTSSQTNNNKTEPNTNKADNQIVAEGKQLNVMYSDPPTLDPHIAQDSTSAGIILEIYSGLVSLDTNLQIIPDIA